MRSPLGKSHAVDTNEIYQAALKAKSNITYTGFIAQEVEEAASKSSFDFSGIVAPEDENDHYTLRYAEFVVPLVKAVQEQQEIIEKKEQKIEDLEARLEALMSIEIKQTESRTFTADPQHAKLSQNSPNPANGMTTIEYFIPAGAKEASLLITNSEGKVIKHQHLPLRGLGHLELQSFDFQAGQYFYSLLIDGHAIDTKQMLLINK